MSKFSISKFSALLNTVVVLFCRLLLFINLKIESKPEKDTFLNESSKKPVKSLVTEANVTEIPLGIFNQQNTCYLNSVLQCLYHIPAFSEHVKDPNESVNFSEQNRAGSSLDQENTSVIYGLSKLFYQLKNYGKATSDRRKEESSPKQPSAASTVALTVSMGIDVRYQQDMQEFTRLLMDALEKEGGERIKNLIDSIFRGKTSNYIKAPKANFSKERSEVFYDLSLEIKDKSNLWEAIRSYTEEEILDGDNQYNVEGFGKVASQGSARNSNDLLRIVSIWKE